MRLNSLLLPVCFITLGAPARAFLPSSISALSRVGSAFAVRTQYNFAPASGRDDELVHGCERPAASDAFNTAGAIPPSEVEAWAKFMKSKGIERTLCLLNPEELSYFDQPGYAGGLEAAGFAQDKITCIDVFSEGAAERTAAALAAAKAANEKLVLHCAGGEGRTAVVLAQWLVGEGLGDTAAVCKDLVAFAATKDAARKAVSLYSVSHPIDPAKVDKYLSTGTLK